MTFTRTEVVDLVVKLGEMVGKNLLTLAMQAEPKLRTDPLPDATGEMVDAREAAIRRVSEHDSTAEHDTEPPPPSR